MTNIKEHNTTDKEVLVKVEGLSKKFCKDLKTAYEKFDGKIIIVNDFTIKAIAKGN